MSRKYTGTSVSLTPEMKKKALARARSLGFRNSLSAYIQRLIEKDIDRIDGEESKREKKAA